MSGSFTTEAALPKHRAAFGAVAFVLCAAALAVLATHSVALAPSLRVVVAAIAIAVPAGWVTAYLLEAQFRLSRRLGLGVLGGAFWFSALMSIAYLLSLPWQGDDPNLALDNEQTATWLWVAWRLGFIAFVVAYVVIENFFAPKRLGAKSVRVARICVGAGVPILVGLIAYTIEDWNQYLPPVVSDGRVDLRFSIVVGFPALVFHVILLIAFAALTRLRSLTNLALGFALLAWLLGDLLTLSATARFTLGWYVGLLDYVASSLAIPVVFVIRLHSLYVDIQQANESLSALALVDGLTGLPNRRLFDRRLEAEWAGATRRHEHLALIMADIDHFKRFNDRYGHVAGDDCLRRIAQTIRDCAHRALDLPARYGGEEFAVILPATDLGGAALVAERIRSTVQDLAIEHQDGGPSNTVSMSLGVAVWFPKPSQSPHLLTSAADRALYRAKGGGKNQVVVQEQSADGLGFGQIGR
jgi:diguanylate cyclase (GGDEF)-like protein